MAKKTVITDKSVEDLKKMLEEKREELRHVRFEAAGARAKDSNAPSKLRKEVARILTELAAREKVSN